MGGVHRLGQRVRRTGRDGVRRGEMVERARLVVPLARAAGLFVRRSGWFDCGFARSSDFARERLGRSGRWLHDLFTHISSTFLTDSATLKKERDEID